MGKRHLTHVDDLLPVLCPPKRSLKKEIQLSPQISLDSMRWLWLLLFACTTVEAQGPSACPCQLALNPRCSATRWCAVTRSHDSSCSQERPDLIKHVGENSCKREYHSVWPYLTIVCRKGPAQGWHGGCMHTHERGRCKSTQAPCQAWAGGPKRRDPPSAAAVRHSCVVTART